MKTNALGRGLDALLSDIKEETSGLVREISIHDIDPNPNQPRKHFSEESLRQLADSIEEVGLLQPIIVMPAGDQPEKQTDGRYVIVAGERRWRAARLANLTTIPAIVREADTISRMEVALIENLQREDLNPMEEAYAIHALMDECGLIQEEVARRLGKGRATIANMLRLITLPAQIQDYVKTGDISMGHARCLASVESRTRQLDLAKRVIDEGLSVRALEQLIARREPATERVVVTRKPPAEFFKIETSARETFGMRVNVKGTLNKGRIVLKYEKAEELERFNEILEEIMEGTRG